MSSSSISRHGSADGGLERKAGSINTEVYTSPHSTPDLDPKPRIIAIINGAKNTILMSAYSFTDADYSVALIAAKNRGVAVRVVMDSTSYIAKNSQGPALVAAGVDLRIRGTQYMLNHMKMLIIDGDIVQNGSFNYTTSAEKTNVECCEVKTGAQVARVMAPTYAAEIEDSYSKGKVPA